MQIDWEYIGKLFDASGVSKKYAWGIREAIEKQLAEEIDYKTLFKEAFDLVAWLNLGQDIPVATEFIKKYDSLTK